MLRVTVEMVPFGFENLKKTIGEIQIINDGTGTREIGNYKIKFTTLDPFNEQTISVRGFKRKEGFWQILNKSLKLFFKKDKSKE